VRYDVIDRVNEVNRKAILLSVVNLVFWAVVIAALWFAEHWFIHH